MIKKKKKLMFENNRHTNSSITQNILNTTNKEHYKITYKNMSSVHHINNNKAARYITVFQKLTI